jgi:hypothetical protein
VSGALLAAKEREDARSVGTVTGRTRGERGGRVAVAAAKTRVRIFGIAVVDIVTFRRCCRWAAAAAIDDKDNTVGLMVEFVAAAEEPTPKAPAR